MKFYVVDTKHEGAAFPALFYTKEEAEQAIEGYKMWQRETRHMFLQDPDDLEVVEYELIENDKLFEFLDKWYER